MKRRITNPRARAPARDRPTEAELAHLQVLGARPAKPKPGRAGKQWTEEEDERLASLLEAGQAVAELAAALDRSRAAIRMRMTAQGLVEAT